MKSIEVDVCLKYNGYWQFTPKTKRKRYFCGKQKIVKVAREHLSLKVLSLIIGNVVPSSYGQHIYLKYAVPGSIPKEYKSVKNEKTLADMFKGLKVVGKDRGFGSCA